MSLPNGVEQWSSLSNRVPSDVVSGPVGIMSRFVRVMLSRICEYNNTLHIPVHVLNTIISSHMHNKTNPWSMPRRLLL